MTGKTPALNAKRARTSTSRVVMAAAVLLTALSYTAVNQAQVAGAKPRPSKLDRVLQKAAAAATRQTQRVIVRARPGARPAVADRLTQHGDRIEAKHARLESLTAIVHGDDLRGARGRSGCRGRVDRRRHQRRRRRQSGVTHVGVDHREHAGRALGLSDTELRRRYMSASRSSIPAWRRAKTFPAAALIDFFDFTADGRPATPTTTTATARMSRR